MNKLQRIPRQSGFSMIEVLVALVILLVGLLGLAGVMVQSQRSEMESYQRVQALILLQDMKNRIKANALAAYDCYNYTTASLGTPYVGASGTNSLTIPPTKCTSANIITTFTNQLAVTLSQTKYPTEYTQRLALATASASNAATTAKDDLKAWNDLLQGTAEITGGNSAGAMVGARGCISYDSTTELAYTDPNTGLATGATIPGTGVYTLSVAWQGLGDTFQNTTLLCATGNYGNETKRRVVSLTFRIASL